jgi:hypothetical protein
VPSNAQKWGRKTKEWCWKWVVRENGKNGNGFLGCGGGGVVARCGGRGWVVVLRGVGFVFGRSESRDGKKGCTAL